MIARELLIDQESDYGWMLRIVDCDNESHG